MHVRKSVYYILLVYNFVCLLYFLWTFMTSRNPKKIVVCVSSSAYLQIHTQKSPGFLDTLRNMLIQRIILIFFFHPENFYQLKIFHISVQLFTCVFTGAKFYPHLPQQTLHKNRQIEYFQVRHLKVRYSKVSKCEDLEKLDSQRNNINSWLNCCQVLHESPSSRP